MRSCLWLERPGAWRILFATLILAMATLPVGPLVLATLTTASPATFTGAFVEAVGNSFVVAAASGLIGLALGWPLGTFAATYDFRGRRLLIPLASLPLLIPSFLWAIGWSALAARVGPAATATLSGRFGCIVAFSSQTTALVLLSCYVAAKTITRSQIEAVRLAGGELAVVHQSGRFSAIPACMAAMLGSVLTLADPGPGQILGLRTAGSEVLVSFSAMYDFTLAGRQCLVLAGLVLACAVPSAILTAPRFAAQILVKQTCPAAPRRHRILSPFCVTALAVLILAPIALPLLGLMLPLAANHDFGRAWSEVNRTIASTVMFGLGAGCVASCLGFLLAVCVGRHAKLQVVTLGVGAALFALPPALGALGVAQLATQAPPELDPLLRSRATVAAVLGLRFLPVAVVLGMRAWQSLSATWTYAAAIHGVPLGRYVRRVILPRLAPSLAMTVLLVSLLATADVTTVLLLHPPGEASLPLTIFTVMANAPEALVASLCLVYVGVAVAGLTALGGISGICRRS